MIDKRKIAEIVRTYLPKAEDDTVEGITNSIIQDAEAVIRSMLRQAVAQERESLYRQNNQG